MRIKWVHIRKTSAKHAANATEAFVNMKMKYHHNAKTYHSACSVKAELNQGLCFETLEPAWAWDGVAARTNGHLPEGAALANTASSMLQFKGPGSSQVLPQTQLERSLDGDMWFFGIARGGGVAGHPGARWWWLPRRGGQPGAPPPASPAQSRHGKLLRANVAGTMESPGLPSAEILGCVSYAHRHGSSESLVYTRPRHITVFFLADTISWSRGRRKKFEGVAVRQEPRSHVCFFSACPKMFLRSMNNLTHCIVYSWIFSS